MAKLSDTDNIALGELEALLKVPGALKIITAEVQPKLRQDAKEARSPAQADADLTRPDTFVCHDVVHLEAHPTKEGYFLASSAEGDWTMGRPEALVRRLRQWRGDS